MEIVLILMLAGILLGYVIRSKTKILHVNDKLVSLTIYLLLFFLGITVGTNRQIIQHFDTIGYYAVMISLGSTLGSVVVAFFVYKYFFQREHEE